MAYVVVVNYVVVGLFLAYSFWLILFLAYSWLIFFGFFLMFDVNSRLKKPFVGSKPKYHI
jgi:hypothetical protein